MLFLVLLFLGFVFLIFITYHIAYGILSFPIIPNWLKVILSAILCYPGTILSGIIPCTGLFAIIFETALFLKNFTRFDLLESWEPILPKFSTDWADVYTNGIFVIWLMLVGGFIVHYFYKIERNKGLQSTSLPLGD